MAQAAIVQAPAPSAVSHCPVEIVELGMPQLALSGLSEGWLLRECGSRHWSAIAASFEAPPERLTDAGGNRLYASFLATRIAGGPLAAFREGDRVRIRTHLARLSRNRFLTRHHIMAFGSAAAVTVEMVSALLKRERARDNTSLREGDVHRVGGWEPRGEPPVASDLFAADKALRGRCRQAGTEPHTDGDTLERVYRYRYRPLPSSDFNGAGLLYFANYHAIVDRAEWEWRPTAGALAWTTTRRDTFFFANINPGDPIDVLLAPAPGVDELRHRARLFRVSDGRLMAEVATVKRSGP